MFLINNLIIIPLYEHSEILYYVKSTFYPSLNVFEGNYVVLLTETTLSSKISLYELFLFPVSESWGITSYKWYIFEDFKKSPAPSEQMDR